MKTDVYSKMAADTVDFWDQSIDWIRILLSELNSPDFAGRLAQSPDLTELLKLCHELEPLLAPTDAHALQVRRLQVAINPHPSAQALEEFGGHDYEPLMDLMVQQHHSRPEALALRRTASMYRHLSFILEAVGARKRAS